VTEAAVTYESFAPKASAMFGCEDWKDIHEARRRDLITPEEFRDELLNLMRWRLEHVLRYGITHALELKNTQGAPIYSMVFATDNEAGNKIMSQIYESASLRHPRMRAEAAALSQAAREAKQGNVGLFPPPAREPRGVVRYEHTPPHAPFRLSPEP
jgi:hypothetical protein